MKRYIIKGTSAFLFTREWVYMYRYTHALYTLPYPAILLSPALTLSPPLSRLPPLPHYKTIPLHIHLQSLHPQQPTLPTWH